MAEVGSHAPALPRFHWPLLSQTPSSRRRAARPEPGIIQRPAHELIAPYAEGPNPACSGLATLAADASVRRTLEAKC